MTISPGGLLLLLLLLLLNDLCEYAAVAQQEFCIADESSIQKIYESKTLLNTVYFVPVLLDLNFHSSSRLSISFLAFRFPT